MNLNSFENKVTRARSKVDPFSWTSFISYGAEKVSKHLDKVKDTGYSFIAPRKE